MIMSGHRTVLIVRHAMPDVRDDIAPSAWVLNADGRAAAAGLRGRLPEQAHLASSPEPKALETLTLAAGVEPDAVAVDHRFGEVRRPGEPVDDDHRNRRFAWVSGRPDERHRTWETRAAAAERFQAGLDAIDADRVVVGSHGMVLVAWLISRGVIEDGAVAGRYWSDLGFPDLIDVRL